MASARKGPAPGQAAHRPDLTTLLPQAPDPDAPEVDVDDDDVVVETDTTVVADEMVTIRPTNSWTLNYGLETYEFVQGKRYRVRKDVADYLKRYPGTLYLVDND